MIQGFIVRRNSSDPRESAGGPGAAASACPFCEGSGTCSQCDGDGGRVFDRGWLRTSRWLECEACGGTETCGLCHGTGEAPRGR